MRVHRVDAPTRPLTRQELAELARPPAPEELAVAVGRAVRGEVSLEEAVSVLVYGRFDTGDPAWCEVGQSAWRVALWAYQQGPQLVDCGDRPLNPTDVYVALRTLSPDPVAWWRLPGVSWGVLAAHLGVGVRAAQYHLRDRLGFAFSGSVFDRALTLAPCVRCGRIAKPWLLVAFRCGDCSR